MDSHILTKRGEGGVTNKPLLDWDDFSTWAEETVHETNVLLGHG